MLPRLRLGLILILLALLVTSPARAQYQPIPNFTGVGAGQQFRNAVNGLGSGATPISPRLVAVPFAILNVTPEQDGQVFWCRDCAQGPVCSTGGSTGAVAVGANGQWTCVLGPTAVSGGPSGAAGGDLASSYPNPIVNTVKGGLTPATTNGGINQLNPATGNYSMNGWLLRGLQLDAATGDAMSKNQSVLSDLAGPGGTNFGMSGLTFNSVGAATAGGEPVVAGVTNTANGTFLGLNNRLNPVTYAGAKGDGFNCVGNGTSVGGSVSSGVLTVAGCTGFPGFSSADIGKYIAVAGAGGSGAPYQGTIANYGSSSAVTLSGSPANVSDVSFAYGTDNTTPLQTTETACENAGSTAMVDIPPGQYITGPVQLGNPSTAITTVGSSTEAPGCAVTSGAGRLSTSILSKPAAAYAFQRHNAAGTTVQSIIFEGALTDGLINDQPVGLLDMSWLGGAPSAQNNLHDLYFRSYKGVGLNAYLNNDSNIGEIWSAPQWLSGQSQTGAISTCTESSTSACGSGLTATCNITSGPFLIGEWVAISGDSVSGYNQASAVQLTAAAGGSISYCAYTGSLGTGTGGTATLAPITIDARGPGGPMAVHDFVSSGQPGLMVVGSQNWQLFNFDIAGGLQIDPIDYNSGLLDSGQLLDGDSLNSQIQIESPVGSLNNASPHSLILKNVLVAGPPGTVSTVFDGRYWNGVEMQAGILTAVNGPLNVFGTITPESTGNDWWPHFDFDGVSLQGASFNPPSNIEWSLNGSCEASTAGTGACGATSGNTLLCGTSVIGTPMSCNSGVQINMESAFKAAGTPVPGPGGGACSNILNSREPICALDTSTAGCTAGTAYVSGGSNQCRLYCSGTTWKNTGAPC